MSARRSAFGAGGGALQALSKDAARRILAEGHHRHQQSHLERLATALGGSGPNLLRVHLTPSLLTSASLLAHFVKHRVLRNLEHMSNPVIRRTTEMADEKHRIWSHHTSQHARRVQCEQALGCLQVRQAALQTRLRFDPANAALKNDLLAVQSHAQRLHAVCASMEDAVKGSLHPASLLQGDRVFLTPTETARLPSPSATVRGILIRIKGPRRGNRSMVWQRSAGRVSVNSVRYVAAEEAKVPIPTKLGIYGLTVRIVHCRRDRLVDCRRPLSVADRPGPFVFHPAWAQ